MDASQYLRRLKESCPKIVSRRQDCRTADEHTHMLGLLATTTYISQANRVEGRIPLACASAKPAQGGTEVTPVDTLPGVSCASGLCSNYFSDRYTTPIITIPGCAYPAMSSTYIQTCVTPCVQGSPWQQRAAVKLATDRKQYSCC